MQIYMHLEDTCPPVAGLESKKKNELFWKNYFALERQINVVFTTVYDMFCFFVSLKAVYQTYV